jgi:multicomponent Na+:H+ antiporter subunit B
MGIAKETRGMTLIVKTVTRITLGFILLYGIYIALHGHMQPGGGFAGGVIIALSLIHIMLAFGKEVALKRLRAHQLRFTISIASLIFIYIVMAPWRASYLRLAMPFCEMIIVGAGIFAIFVALVLLSKSDKDSE